MAAGKSDLLATLPRCERPAMPHLKMYDVAPGDDAVLRRRKWGLRAVDIWATPCSNSTGPSYACVRCTQSFLQAIDNPPEGPWAP